MMSRQAPPSAPSHFHCSQRAMVAITPSSSAMNG